MEASWQDLHVPICRSLFRPTGLVSILTRFRGTVLVRLALLVIRTEASGGCTSCTSVPKRAWKASLCEPQQRCWDTKRASHRAGTRVDGQQSVAQTVHLPGCHLPPTCRLRPSGDLRPGASRVVLDTRACRCRKHRSCCCVVGRGRASNSCRQPARTGVNRLCLYLVISKASSPHRPHSLAQIHEDSSLRWG